MKSHKFSIIAETGGCAVVVRILCVVTRDSATGLRPKEMRQLSIRQGDPGSERRLLACICKTWKDKEDTILNFNGELMHYHGDEHSIDGSPYGNFSSNFESISLESLEAAGDGSMAHHPGPPTG